MKILVTRSSAGGIGGGERSALDYAFCFNKLGHEVLFISSLPWVRERAREIGLTPHRIVWPNRHAGLLRIVYYLVVAPVFWLQCIYYVLRYRPDIINPQSREDWIAFTLLKWLHHRPVVWREPSDLRHYLEEKPRSIFGRFNKHLLLRALRKVDNILTLNEDERQIILKMSEGNLDPERISVVSSNIIYEEYDLKAKPPKETDRLIILTTSLLREHKGIHFAIEAFQRLEKKHKNLEFWIIGDGPYLPELELHAAGNEHIVFWGFISEQSPFLARADIFLAPALFEGWGRSLKEAKFFGIPSVGSNVGGTAIQIDHDKTGFLIEPGNVDELTDYMEKLIKDKALRKKIGDAARQDALEEGDYVDLVRNIILPIFEAAVAKNSDS